MASNQRIHTQTIQLQRPVVNAADIQPVTPEEITKRGLIDTAIRVVSYGGLRLFIQPMLGIRELPGFIGSVLSACYDEERGTMHPELMDFAVRINTIVRYANVELPEQIEDQYALAYLSGIYETILGYTCKAQHDALVQAIRDEIQSIMVMNNGTSNNRMGPCQDQQQMDG